jgi:indole-3-glycerol phosphate synthase
MNTVGNNAAGLTERLLNRGRFSNAIIAEAGRGRVPVIPDIKCVSPKEGDLLRGRDPVKTAAALTAYGAAVLSVVTEAEHFGGSVEMLRAVVCKTNVPVLRKDFIRSEHDLIETVEVGASAVLLICSIMDAETLKRLYRQAINLQLEPFVETHNEAERALAAELGASLIGINNRNITTLERDDGGTQHTATLARLAPPDALLVSESGIQTPEDVRIAVNAGAGAVLVGTALWQASNMEAAFNALRYAV